MEALVAITTSRGAAAGPLANSRAAATGSSATAGANPYRTADQSFACSQDRSISSALRPVGALSSLTMSSTRLSLANVAATNVQGECVQGSNTTGQFAWRVRWWENSAMARKADEVDLDASPWS